MADLLQRGSDWLLDQQRAHCSRTVVYRRGEQAVALPAVVGRTRLEADDELGRAREEVRDYLIQAVDLLLDGQPAEPQLGDRIVETLGGRTCLYEVLQPRGEDSHFRYVDPGRKAFRIHTLFVGVE